MRLILDRTQVHQALLAIREVANRKSTIEGTSQFLLEAAGNELTAYATNLESFASVRVPVEVQESGVVAVPAYAFCDLLKIQPDEKVRLTVNEKHRLTLAVKSSKYQLAGCKPKVFPKVVETPQDLYSAESAMLRYLLDHTLYAVSSEDTRYSLSGVHFDSSGEYLRAVASDTRRLALHQEDLELDQYFAVTLGRTGLERLYALLKTNETFEYHIGEKWAHFRVANPNVTLAIRIIDEPYLDYRSFIPVSSRYWFTFETPVLSAALKRLKAVGEEFSVVTLEPGKTDVRLSLFERNGRIGGEEVVEAGIGGEDPQRVGVSLSHLLEALPKESKQVHLQFESPRSPILVRPDEPEGCVAVVVPHEI